MVLRVLLVILAFTPPAAADTNADIYKLIGRQLWVMEPSTDGDDGRLGALFVGGDSKLAMDPDEGLVAFNSDAFTDRHGGLLDSSRQGDMTITLARDGKSAWVSFTSRMTFLGSTTTRDYRISEVVATTAKGWLIAGGTWTVPASNAAVNDAALAGSITEHTKLAGKAEPTLLAAFKQLLATGVDAAASARADLVVFGSGPGERTVGGSGFSKAWEASWIGRLAIDGPVIAKLAPSKTTGFVIANIKLAKTKAKKPYKIPFRVFCVFDKDDKGAWSLVHMHLSTKV